MHNILNNLKNALTKKSLNKQIYKKIVCNVLLLTNFYKEDTNYIAKRKKNRREVTNFIVFVNIKIKPRYNNFY